MDFFFGIQVVSPFVSDFSMRESGVYNLRF